MRIKALLLAAATLFSLSFHKLHDIAGYVSVDAMAASAENYENPFDKQDDKEVPYDGTRWIQPVEWNVRTVNPRDYDGGIMLFFDKIGLDPDKAPGKVQRFYFSVRGATEKVGLIKFHIYYDTRLKIKKNSNGEVITPGKALEGFSTGSSMIKDGQLAFYGYSDDTELSNSSILTIDFIIPDDAEPGDLYPIGIAYTDDGIVADTFIKQKHDEAGRLQMTYVFSKGIYNGYIKMMGEKKIVYSIGDVNNDKRIDAADATDVLSYYAMISTNGDGEFTDAQKSAGDVNKDGRIDAGDASYILSYYAYSATVKGDIISFEEFMVDKT